MSIHAMIPAASLMKLYLFHFYILIYYKNIGTKSSIFQYIYIDHHRWLLLRSIINESSIKITIPKKGIILLGNLPWEKNPFPSQKKEGLDHSFLKMTFYMLRKYQ